LVIVCEWPAVGIPVTRVTVDGNLIREAASQSPKLWPDTAEVQPERDDPPAE